MPVRKKTQSKFNVLAFGLSTGLMLTVGVMIMGILAVSMGNGGYISFGGMLFKSIWMFINGFVAGIILAWLYNAFLDVL